MNPEDEPSSPKGGHNPDFIGNFVRVYECNGLFRFIVHKNGVDTISGEIPYRSSEEAIDAAIRAQESGRARRKSI